MDDDVVCLSSDEEVPTPANGTSKSNDAIDTGSKTKTSAPTKLESSKSVEKISKLVHTLKFKEMDNFDPERSIREQRKISKKIKSDGRSKSPTKGRIDDSCDCLEPDCPGCYFPCRTCRSCKCGNECRAGRKHKVDLIINQCDLSQKTGKAH